VLRNGEPIEDARAKNAVDPHISFSVHYNEFDAAIAAGATLEELSMLETYPKSFRAKLIAWHNFHKLIEMHSQDAATPKGNK
jgi:hypothetical protein